MHLPGGTVDDLIADLASRSHGVVTRKTLLGKGVSAEEIKQRLRRGSLLRQHPGVYRVGHRAPSVEAKYLGAVLACGDGSLLVARAAAHLWDLIKGSAPRPEVIAVVKRRVQGVTTHRVRRIHTEDAGRCRGIPVTTVPRTLVDLAGILPEQVLARACHEAEVRHQVTPDHVEAVLARLPTRRGARTLRRILHGEIPVTLSRLEQRFLGVLRAEGLPLPETNRPAGGRRVDCRWPVYRLTVELDSYRYHRSRHAWEGDRRREREAYARGDDFRRYTAADVFDDPTLMFRELTALLKLERSN
jgi:Transcriptional regulator, AbiEi antitoxin